MNALNKNYNNETKLLIFDKATQTNTVESFSNINIFASWKCGVDKKNEQNIDKATGKKTPWD